jgi:hypothetical protein
MVEEAKAKRQNILNLKFLMITKEYGHLQLSKRE